MPEHSDVYYAKARALADAGNMLPYFVNSGLVVARHHNDQVVISNTLICMTILAVPYWPDLSPFRSSTALDVPRRGFDLYPWLSAFYAHELVAERPAGINKDMDLKDIIDHTSELKFQYVGWHLG